MHKRHQFRCKPAPLVHHIAVEMVMMMMMMMTMMMVMLVMVVMTVHHIAVQMMMIVFPDHGNGGDDS